MSGSNLLLWAVLVPTVASVWLGCLATLRLPTALDRLHAVSFVNIAGGGGLTLACFVADGVSVRSMKVLGLTLLLIVAGAALSHATGRALLIREGRKA
ncbi:monovalent cation/H(+) antiporter subunit G [Methylobacterium sp. WL9]|uniref:monovalent cation/H(+) antiporter subunit G n=1 Tax=Methylobacterium sp. WL9 TaxID=2603898 RepID=UPI0011C8462C|nr:monovalent cation/H(+) antiporter subunit G [Methylobacterium sp. WL9]TXN23223.1 monovalent cation/H(+) antiporter subunit G [Methylobacterium sp. WL9]